MCMKIAVDAGLNGDHILFKWFTLIQQVQMWTIDAIKCYNAMTAWMLWQLECFDSLNALTATVFTALQLDCLDSLNAFTAWMLWQLECFA